jgi:MFS family permease
MMEPPQALNGSAGGSTTAGRWTARLVLSTLFMALVLEALGLGATMMAIGLPSVLQEFPTTQGGWLTTSYFLAGAVCAPLLGKAADLYGKRKVLLVTLVISGIGALVCALAPSFAILIVGRTLQGVILATISLVPSLIRDVFPPRQAVLASSIVITGMGAFSLFAPLLIGWLLAIGGFRGLFWFDTVWTFVIAVGILLTTNESTLRRASRPDVVGGVLLALGVVPLLLYVSLGRTVGWVSVIGAVLIVASIVFLVLFFRHAKRAPDPIVKLELFRRKPLLFVAIGGAIAYAVSASAFQVVPMLAMTPREAGVTYGLGLSTVQYAAVETPKALASVVAGLLLGFLVARGRKARTFMLFGLACWVVGPLLLGWFNDSYGSLLIGAMVIGLGGGFTVAAVPTLVMRATPAGDQGSTAGTVQLCQTGLSSILPVVMFAVLAPHAQVFPTGVVYSETGFRTWFVISAALAALMLVLALTWLRERKGDSPVEFSIEEPVPAGVGAGGAAASATPAPEVPKV